MSSSGSGAALEARRTATMSGPWMTFGSSGGRWDTLVGRMAIQPVGQRTNLVLQSAGETLDYSRLWRRLIPDRPASTFQGQLAAIAAVAGAGLLRWTIQPQIGAEASFLIAVPAILLITLVYGRLAATTALTGGAALDLLFSVGVSGMTFPNALPRFIVWLCSATLIVVVGLGLRGTLLSLKARERDLVAAGDQLKLLIHELEHRGRNALAIIQAVSSDTARTAPSVEEYERRLGGRLEALATSYSRLTRSSSEQPDLLQLVRDVLAPFSGRIRVKPSEACRIRSEASVPMALALHELATNASKYGALSTESGEVLVAWEIAADGSIVFHWTEIGGPAPAEAASEGFGSRLLRNVFSGAGGGELHAERRPEGMAFQIRLPRAGHAGLFALAQSEAA